LLSLTAFAPTNDAFNALDAELAFVLDASGFQHLKSVARIRGDGNGYPRTCRRCKCVKLLKNLTVSIDETTVT
jgi:hypothetical protein